MKRKRTLITVLALLLVLALLAGLSLAQEPVPPRSATPAAQVGTAFTYQGRLTDGGSPADGVYDLEFKLYDDASFGTLLGTVAHDDVPVAGGLFTVQLDFGAGLFRGEARWLQIGVRPGAGLDPYTPLTPRQQLTPTPYALALPGLWTDQNPTSPNVVGGYPGNSFTPGAVGATIGGGGRNSEPNRVTDDYGTIGGGYQNQAGNDTGAANDAPLNTVGGGIHNIASGYRATISGGGLNLASNYDATIGGGYSNQATHLASTIGGGTTNIANGYSATIGGGYGNKASGFFSTIGGGGRSDPLDAATGNRATDNYATVGGGADNRAGDDDGDVENATYATVAGGRENAASAVASAIGGGTYNVAQGTNATVAGGNNNHSGNYAFVGGGSINVADGSGATIGGGGLNTASGVEATIGGGFYNEATADYATIAGGSFNEATASYATVSGGGSDVDATGNHATDEYATVGGGYNNQAGDGDAVPTNARYATVGGGISNQASKTYSTIAGGYDNATTGVGGTVGGGFSNQAGFYGSVPGGYNNAATASYSFAAGYAGQATHSGAFVWSAGQNTGSWGSNTFTARAHGGARFYSASGTATGVQLSAGGTSWGVVSDRSVKEDFAAVDLGQLLDTLAATPLQTWSLKAQSPAIRHLGPVAQDFNGLFGYLFGRVESPRHINTMDAVGLSRAAAQGLYERSQDQADRIETLRAENAGLQQQIDDLEARLAALEATGTRGFSSSSFFPWWILAGLAVAGTVVVRWQYPGGGR
jgi:hypothetical protein